QPETEVKYFKLLPLAYPELNLLFCGDFNLPQSHTVFNPLKKMGYMPALINQKTSLKKNCLELACLSEEFDNMFYNTRKVKLITSDVIHFYKQFPTMNDANMISDHLPIISRF